MGRAGDRGGSDAADAGAAGGPPAAAATGLTIAALALFIASTAAHALLAPPPASHAAAGTVTLVGESGFLSLLPGSLAEAPLRTDLVRAMLAPATPVLWLMLVALWVVLALHALRLADNHWRAHRAGGGAGPVTGGAADAGGVAHFLDAMQDGPRPRAAPLALGSPAPAAARDLAPLALAMLAGAAWPWAARWGAGAGFLCAALMLAALLATVIRGQREGGRIRHSAAVGFAAGWATAAALAAFAGLIEARLPGVPVGTAGALAMLLAAGTGVAVQWRLGHSASYSVGLIWALMGIAAATVIGQPAVATAAILGVAAMGVVFIRAAS